MARIKYPNCVTLDSFYLEKLAQVIQDAREQGETIYSFDFDYKKSHLGFLDLDLITFRAYSEDDNFTYSKNYRLSGTHSFKYATLTTEHKTLKEKE